MGLFEDKEEGEIFGLVITTFSTFPQGLQGQKELSKKQEQPA